jgi:ADP-heptose:LPS heptosyltransferase
MDVLVNRTAANGDVLVASAVMSAIKKKHPGCTTFFSTACPATVMHHPYIDNLVSMEAKDERFAFAYDLDRAYENKPNDNILDAYCEAAEVSREDCEFHLLADAVNKSLFKDYVVIHAGMTNWVGRNWSDEEFRALAMMLHNEGLQIICVGSPKDRFVPSDADARGRTTPRQLATIIRDAKLFVGIDSMPMHVAQFTNTPGVVFFGSVKPETRIYRSNMVGVTVQIPCLGCHHRKPSPCFLTDICETGGEECVTGLKAPAVFEQCLSLLKS